MARVASAVCDKCGQAHSVVIGEWASTIGVVETCGECKLRLAKEALHDAQQSVHASARRLTMSGDRYNFDLANALVDEATIATLIEWVCHSRSDRERIDNERRFWDDVRKEIER